MSQPVSSLVPAAKRALVDQLSIRPALSGVTVARSWPGEAAGDRCIYLGKVTGRHEFVTLRAGRKPRAESFTVELMIFVATPGKEPADAEDLAFEILAEVENLLADTPSLGLEGVFTAQLGDFNDEPGYRDEESAAAHLSVGVVFKNRLA